MGDGVFGPTSCPYCIGARVGCLCTLGLLVVAIVIFEIAKSSKG